MIQALDIKKQIEEIENFLDAPSWWNIFASEKTPPYQTWLELKINRSLKDCRGDIEQAIESFDNTYKTHSIGLDLKIIKYLCEEINGCVELGTKLTMVKRLMDMYASGNNCQDIHLAINHAYDQQCQICDKKEVLSTLQNKLKQNNIITEYVKQVADDVKKFNTFKTTNKFKSIIEDQINKGEQIAEVQYVREAYGISAGFTIDKAASFFKDNYNLDTHEAQKLALNYYQDCHLPLKKLVAKLKYCQKNNTDILDSNIVQIRDANGLDMVNKMDILACKKVEKELKDKYNKIKKCGIGNLNIEDCGFNKYRDVIIAKNYLGRLFGSDNKWFFEKRINIDDQEDTIKRIDKRIWQKPTYVVKKLSR
jgi:hypothetical protein